MKDEVEIGFLFRHKQRVSDFIVVRTKNRLSLNQHTRSSKLTRHEEDNTNISRGWGSQVAWSCVARYRIQVVPQ